MLRIALLLAALMIAVMPAAFGVLQNDLFTPETPARIHEQTIEPAAPQLHRPEPNVDRRTSGTEDSDSPRAERPQAHNVGDD